jgi:regulator of sigma E protease
MTPIGSLPSGPAAIFWGVITFSLLVVLHEGGHFLAARTFGVKVHEFMLGLPGPALRWRSKRTGISYGVTALPLGGYVRIAGMEPGAEDELLGAALGLVVDRRTIDAATLATELSVPRERANALLTTLEDYLAAAPVEDSMDSSALVERLPSETDEQLLTRVRSTVYRGQPAWKRITILAMGVIVNILSAIIILVLALTIIGVPKPVPTIASVYANTGAAAAGLRRGDTITSIDGRAVSDWTALKAILKTAKPGVALQVGIRRGGTLTTVKVTPTAATDGTAQLGVQAVANNVPVAFGEAVQLSLSLTGQVFVAVGRFFNPSTFAASLQGARSVVGISYEVATAASEGVLPYAVLVALLSLSLGIMNILPIPPLDGGKIAVELVEAVLRRPVPRRLSLAVSAVGTLLLFSLIFYLMYADVLRYIVNKG